MTDYNVPREPRFKRPILYPPDGDKRVPYSRPSTLGKDIDDGKGLIPWEQSMVAIGLARSRHLFSRVQAIVARGGGWHSDKKQFKEIVESAKNAAGWKDQADRGSTIHDFADAAEQDILDWDLVPDHIVPVMESYIDEVVPKLKYIATEAFVAVDRPVLLPNNRVVNLRAAGSIDRICEYKGKRYIVDIKSGRDDVFRVSVSGQLYLYATGKLYKDDVVEQERDWAVWEPAILDQGTGKPRNPSFRAETGVDQDVAIMLQAPKRKPWKWRTHWVPLDRGRDVIECGQWARKARSIPEFEEFEL